MEEACSEKENRMQCRNLSSLICAARQGKLSRVEELIVAGTDVNATCECHGNGALVSAAMEGHIECLKELIKAGAKLDLRNKNGSTALIASVCNGRQDCMKELLKAGADSDIADNEGDTALLHAISAGLVDCVKELIVAGADVNIGSEKVMSPLISAIKEENIECVKELLKADADVNATDGVDTALMVACQKGNETIVKLLLEEGAEVNTENSAGITALYLAVTLGHAEFKRAHLRNDPKYTPYEGNIRFSVHTNLMFLLLQAGAQIKETSLDLNPCTVHLQPSYSDNPNYHILNMLSVAGANIGDAKSFSLKHSLKSLTRNSIREHLKQIHPESNLYFAVPKLDLPSLLHSYLLFDTLSKDHSLNNDEKEFLLKTSEGDGENVRNLIQTGVDVNTQDENGMTALMMTCTNGCLPLVEELIKARTDVDIQNLFGNTALICATLNRQNECVRKLLERGVNTDIQGKDGLTALMYAAKNADVKCLQTLIDGGADPTILNDDDANITRVSGHIAMRGRQGTTALIYAARTGNVVCVQKLIEAGADVNSRSKIGSQSNTPLTAAIENGNVECVKELIQAGVDLNILEKSRIPGLITTSSCKTENCFSELMKAGAEVNSSFLALIAKELFASENTDGMQMINRLLFPDELDMPYPAIATGNLKQCSGE